MQAFAPVQGSLPHVDRLALYCTPQGEIIVRLCTMRISVSPDEARELLEEFLARASRFSASEKLNSNGHVPTL